MKWLAAIITMATMIDSVPHQDTTRVDTTRLDTVLVRSYEQRRAITVRKANIIQGDLNSIDAKLDSLLKKLEEK